MSLTEKEENILASIKVASENNPNRPEFPLDDPKVPATPTFEIDVPGFENVWLKDESINPNGTHKDRMAWEIVKIYKHFLQTKKKDQTNLALPRLSIITSGTAGIAIQSMLKKFKLPNLKVLIDKRTSTFEKVRLQQIKCEIFEIDLGAQALDWHDVLRLTDNPNGFDITSNEAFEPNVNFYEWIAFEILNENPDYCFIPFGSGTLYENILNALKKETFSPVKDPRFTGNLEIVNNCEYFGATTNDPISKAVGLYSPHKPFSHYDEQWIRTYRRSGVCGQKSSAQLIKDSFLEKAKDIADKNKITASYSGIAGLAIMLQMENKLQKNKKKLVVNTGKPKL
jgi:hypothetical protein